MRVETSHEEGGTRDWSVNTVKLTGDADGNVRQLHGIRVGPPPKFEQMPGTEFAINAELVLLAMGFTGPVRSGLIEQLGVELDAPLVSDAAFRAGFTNELGVEGRTRFLRNVMGFWMLQEVLREYAAEGASLDAAQVTREARAVTPRLFLVDAQSDVFLAPGDMRGRLAAECTRRGGPAPSTPAEFARCILDSLALSYRRVVEELVDVTGTRIDDVRIVGGGALNELLCQLTADATGRTVFAGPVEAAALGNAVVQWRSLGVLEGTLDDVRALIGRSFTVQTYEPDVTQSLEWVRVAASMP